MSSQPRKGGVAFALLIVSIVLAAFLTAFLTLPLLNGSVVVFGVVAGCCWAVVFAAAVLLSRSLGRSDPANRSAAGEPLGERSERILDDPVPNHSRLESVAGGEAHAQKGLN